MVKVRSLIAVLLGSLPVLAAADITTVSAEEVHAALVGGRPVALVDARTSEEYAQAHLPGAISIFAPTLRDSRALLPKDPSTRIIFYCRGGG